MPLYTDSLLSDCDHMSDRCFGRYMRLLIRWWRRGAKPLSERELKKLSRAAGEDLQHIKDELTLTDDGWVKKKLFELYPKQLKRAHIAAENGRKGGRPKVYGESELDPKRNPVGFDLGGGIQSLGKLPNTHSPTSKENPPSQKLTPSARGGFDIMGFLGEDALAKARKAAPGWDIYTLASLYNQGVGERGAPKIPERAFPAWCAKYTKGKSP